MPEPITLTAIESQNLDTVCYRGSAPLSVLTQLSQVDVFDQVENPEGLQRDLSKLHALKAYDYAARPAVKDRPRAFPEVVLNVRDKKVLTIREDMSPLGGTVADLEFDLGKILAAKTTKVSRVDGNHRLFFGNGDGKERPALDAMVPFQIHVGLTREQEGSMFLDINAEQKGLNTSHLHVLRSKLTTEEVELELHPERVFARWLANDEVSPWNGRVFLGGSKQGIKRAGESRPVSFVALEAGVRRLLRAEYLQTIANPQARYTAIRAYWQAVASVLPEQFANPADYITLKNVGIQALSSLGVKVINRALMTGQVDTDDMAVLVAPAALALDWHKDSPQVAGMSGNRAALLLAGIMEEHLPPLT